MKRALAMLGLACVLACTPAEQQSAAKAVSDGATCIRTQSAVQGATATSVLETCGFDLAPDLVAVAEAVIADIRARAAATK